MSVEGLLGALVITVIVALWVWLPLLRQERKTAALISSPIERQRERLVIYYGRVLRNIRDLDEDYSTGKLNAEEYQRERELWAQRGVAVLKALDELDDTHLVADVKADDASIDAAIDDRIDAAVASYKTK